MTPTTQNVYRITKAVEDFQGLKSIKEDVLQIEKNKVLVKTRVVTLNFLLLMKKSSK